jgi:UDP-N-acetylmuramoyl-L-alanyl-D-glutamate--2,6-diaminopimelate ligase
MELRALLTDVDSPSVAGDAARHIRGIAYDSRDTRPGFLFAALRGRTQDGHHFIDDAVSRGAVVVVIDRPAAVPAGVTVIRVADSRRALGQISAAFYGHAGRAMRLVGATGTNGKGATTFLVESILRAAGYRCGIVGTMGTIIDGQVEETARTTPEAPDLQKALRSMADRGCGWAAIEVASHALAQERVTGCEFEAGIFTNLTRDHLDFHGSMDVYRAAKARLFAQLPRSGWAILNADDPSWPVMRAVTPARVMTYAADGPADVRARDVRLHLTGSQFVAETPAGRIDVALRLAGGFNVANALGALALGVAYEIPLAIIADALAATPGIPGRFESITEGQPFAVVVDYAHTPDGLENVLRTAREVTAGRLIAVFGCGGDRDRTKRPVMGRLAANWADVVVVTSDNPRTERPEAIIDEIRPGVDEGVRAGARAGRRIDVRYDSERQRAIASALEAATAGDMVVIAGKGHETYQEIVGVKHPFDDREVARVWLREHGFGAGRAARVGGAPRP